MYAVANTLIAAAAAWQCDQVVIFRYDGEEWLNVISRDNDLVAMGWTKEETDYLLDLLEQYDLRFVVVADRYNVSSSSSFFDEPTASMRQTAAILAQDDAAAEVNQQRSDVACVLFCKATGCSVKQTLCE